MRTAKFTCWLASYLTTLCVAIACGAQTATQSNSTVTPEQAQRWLDAFVATRQGELDLSLKRIEWRHFFPPQISTDELDAMRERVRTTPGSLERDKLASEERRSRGELWLDLALVAQADSYRLFTDFSPGTPGGLKYDDTVATPTYAWGLGTRGLRVEGASSSESPSQSARSVGPPFIAELRRVLAANVDMLSRANARLVVSSATKTGWAASGRGSLNQRDWEFQATGTWNADQSGVTLVELRCVVIGANNVGIRWLYSDWKPNADIGFDIAGDVREFDGAGAMVSRILFRKSSRIDAQEFATLVAMPSVGSSDPVRGEIGDRIVKDARGGEPTYTTYKDGVPVATVAKSELPGERSRQRFITIGWIAGLAVLVGIVTVVLRRRHGARHA